MKYPFLAALAVCAGFSCAAQASFFDDDAPAAVAGAGVTFEPVFSANGAPSAAVVKEIASAKKTIRISARSFVSKPVSEAVIKASRAGLDVKIVLDNKTNQGVDSAARFLIAMGYVPHVTTADNAIYQGYLLIDDHDLVIGNIAGLMDSVEEKKNSSSVLVIHNAPDLVQKYLANWQTLWDASAELHLPKD